jgi:hypothetical protein
LNARASAAIFSRMATSKVRIHTRIFNDSAALQKRLIEEKRWSEVDWEFVDRHHSSEEADRLFRQAMKDDKLRF